MISYIRITNLETSKEVVVPIGGGDRYEVAESGYSGQKYAYDAYNDVYTPDGNGIYKKIVDVTSSTPANGLNIKKIDGLGSDKATINTTDYSVNDGSYINGLKFSKRNITISFYLSESNKDDNYGYSTCNIENSRMRLNELMPPKKRVRIGIKTDSYGAERWIEGYVESVKPDPFNKQETVDASIICNDPYFKVSKEVSLSIAMKMNYRGINDAGCAIRVKVTDVSKDLSVNGITLDRTKIPDYSVGNIIEISSRYGNKYIHRAWDGGYDNLIGAAGTGPYSWTYLKNGENTINVLYDGNPPSYDPYDPDSGWPSEDEYIIPSESSHSGVYDNNLVVIYDEYYGGI